MRNNFLILFISIVIVLLLGCPQEPEPEDSEPIKINYIKQDLTNDYSGSNPKVFYVDTTEATELNYEITGLSGNQVYLIFTNPSASNSVYNPIVKTTSPRSVDKTSNVTRSSEISLPTAQKFQRGSAEISEYNRTILNSLDKTRSANTKSISVPDKKYAAMDLSGDTNIFYIDSRSSIAATCRKVVTVGSKSLNIWVADKDWVNLGAKIIPDNVDAIAKKFLLAGADNDVYDWVTAIFGAEWGNFPISYDGYLIPAKDNITILLYDIDSDKQTESGVLGYFWAKDNFTISSVAFSNERIMFYMDTYFYQSHPDEIISTLAHEFQHMIHFYQKPIVNDLEYTSDTWIDEMCAMVAEDLVADKLQVNGPRGVAFNQAGAGSINNMDGRLPLYNYFNSEPLTTWLTGDNVLKSYSNSYAFGAYLARNFGGADLFRKIVQNDKTDYTAITQAIQDQAYLNDQGNPITFEELLRDWGVANILSDTSSLPAGGYYRYNNGSSWMTTAGYNLGSINLYNYRYPDGQGGYYSGPYFHTDSSVGADSGLSNLKKSSNRYFYAGTITGNYQATIKIEKNTRLTVVVK